MIRRWLVFAAALAICAMGACGEDAETSPATTADASDSTGPADASLVADMLVLPDASSDAAAVADSPKATDTAGVPDPDQPCFRGDGGDVAWARRAVQVVLGRHPFGTRELDALVALVRATDRGSVALALTLDDGYLRRWAIWLADEVQVSRTHGAKSVPKCFDTKGVDAETADLAEWVATADPLTDSYAAPFTLRDLARSALLADDLGPFYRGMLFGLLAQPGAACANASADEQELSRRQEFGAKLTSIFLNRTVECLSCHNAEWSTTDRPDPDDDRYWPLPGRLEAGVFGNSYGRPTRDIFGALRFRGVASKEMVRDLEEALQWPDDPAPPRSPWGMAAACGSFVPPDALEPDPLGWGGWLADPTGEARSIWDVERALRAGIDALATGGVGWGQDALVEPPQAFAYLLAARIVDRLWREVFGATLTLGHGSPRNPEQRQRLVTLTETFVASGWSLRALLVEVLLDPLLNPTAPQDRCRADSEYGLPPVLDPFSVEREAPEVRNGPGDIVHRASGRVLVGSLTAALAIPDLPSFPQTNDEEDWLVDAGAFLTDDEPGFAGVDFQSAVSWEGRVGRCLPPDLEGSSQDWLADLEAFAKQPADPPWTLRDVAVALKDRLVSEPDISDAEAPLLAELFGFATLETRLTSASGWEWAMRRLCGVLAASPQFVLHGLAPGTQQTRPRIVLPGEAFSDHCERWAPRVTRDGESAPDCATLGR